MSLGDGSVRSGASGSSVDLKGAIEEVSPVLIGAVTASRFIDRHDLIMTITLGSLHLSVMNNWSDVHFMIGLLFKRFLDVFGTSIVLGGSGLIIILNIHILRRK